MFSLSSCRKTTIYEIVKLYSKARPAEVKLTVISNSWSLQLDFMSTSSTEELLTTPIAKNHKLKLP